MTYRLIATQEEIDALLPLIESADEVALDTEADNMYHYHNRVCLLQIAVNGEIILVDALSGASLKELLSALENTFLIMHGSDFDLRLLSELSGFAPKRIFDTMLAAQLLGQDRFGLASLIERYFGVTVAKSHQKSDWSQRPLPAKMLDYAAQDVVYLFELRDRMQKELEALGRMDWLRQRCEAQLASGSNGFAPRGEHAWRISGARKLSKQGLAVLHELWHWRDKEALRADRPHFKIMNDQFLLRLVEEAEKHGEATGECLPPSLRRRFGRRLRQVVKEGLNRDPATLPPPPPSNGRPEPFTNGELKRQDVFRKARDRVASELKLDPSLLATRTIIGILSREPDRYGELLMPWQIDVLRPTGVFEEIARPITD